jgi:hypothetical protein
MGLGFVGYGRRSNGSDYGHNGGKKKFLHLAIILVLYVEVNGTGAMRPRNLLSLGT